MGSPKPNKEVNQLGRTTQGQQQALQSNIMGGLEGAQARSDQLYNTLYGGYNNLLTGLQAPQGGGGGGGGNPALNAAIAAIQGAKGPSGNLGQMGADIRTRGESLLPAFFDRIRSEQERLQNIQGGYNPGYTAQMSKLSRDQAQSAQKGQLDREIELAKMQRQAQAQAAAFQMQKANALAGLARGRGGGGGSSADDNFRQQMAVLSAMGGLRGQTPGEAAMYMGGGLENIGLGNQQFGQFAQYNPASVPAWQRALGAIGGVAGGLFGGGGAFAPGGRWG